MKPKPLARYAVAVVVFVALCALAAWVAPEGGQGSRAAWCSIIPPVLAISLAFLTRNVLLSLGIAILVGGLLTEVPLAPLSIGAWFRGLTTAGGLVGGTVRSKSNLQTLAFIPPIFIMIEVIIASGGFSGIIVWLLKWVRGRKSAQVATEIGRAHV